MAGVVAFVLCAAVCGFSSDAVRAGERARKPSPVAAAASEPAHAPGYVALAEIEANWDRLPHKDQVLVIEQLLRMQEVDAAERLIDRLEANGEQEKLTRQFYMGMVAKMRGRNGEAIAVFRGLLADHPEFERVRLELAHTLYVAEQDESARHHFEQILGASAANPDVTAMARSYIASIDSRRLWDFSTWVSFAPSTNLNQGTDSRTVNVNGLAFQLADRNVKKSGVGVVLGAQGSYRQPITDRLDAIASLGANFKRYRDGEFNDGSANASLGPRYRFDWGHVGVYAIGDRRWLADDTFATSYGGLVSGLVQVSPQDLVFSDVACGVRRFADDWAGINLTSQDGTYCSVGGRHQHHFDSQTFVNVLANGGRERAGLEHLNNIYWSVGAGISRELPYGVTAYVQGQYTRRNFSGIFPTISESRRDDRYDVTVNLTKRDLELFGLAPMLVYNYTLNDSNVTFQAFDAHGVSLTLTKRF